MFSHSIIINILGYYFLVYGNIYLDSSEICDNFATEKRQKKSTIWCQINIISMGCEIQA